MKPQVVIVHGGNIFPSHEAYMTSLREEPVDLGYFVRVKKWKDTIQDVLEERLEVLRPEMPSPRNAKYEEWCIWFERMIPFLRDGVILVGHSLGGIFLARYLSEHVLPVMIRATILIAPPFGDETLESLGDFRISLPLTRFEEQGGDIHLWASEDDPVVPIGEIKKYVIALPHAHARIFTDRGHFNQETLPELEELLTELWEKQVTR